MDAEEQRGYNLGGITGKGFLPGQSGNPNGRPKGRSITSRLRDILEREEINGKPLRDGKQVADLVAEALIKGARRGDIRHLQELLNRVEGKVPDKHMVTGADGGVLKIKVVYSDAGNSPHAAEAAPGPDPSTQRM